MTLIQSLNFVHLIFNFDLYSLVIRLAILVIKVVLDETKIPALGLINPIVEVPTVDALPARILMLIIRIFFYLNFYILFHIFPYQL